MLRQRIIEDEALEKPFNMEQFKRLLSYMKPYKKQVGITFLLMVIASVCGLLGPLILQIAIDDYMLQGNYLGLAFITLAFLAVNFISMVCVRKRVRIMVVVGQEVLFKLRQDLFNHIQKLSFTFYDSRPAGKILVRIINDVNSLSDLLTNGIINVVTDAFTLVVALIFMFSMHFKLALISMFTVPLMTLVIVLLKKVIRLRWQTVRRKVSNMNAYLHESLAGMRVTQAFVREPETRQVYRQLSRDIYSSWMSAIKANNLFWPSIEWIAAIGTFLIYWFGMKFLDQGTVTVGILVAFTGYVWRFWQPLNNLCNFYNSLLMAMASTERIFELLDIKPDITDKKGAIELPPIKGEVRFDHVTFYYEPEKPVLQDVSFTVKPGETIALVGPTGAGKTTIVSLISRFYDPVEGRVLIDGIDIRDVTLYSLRRQMGIMLQEPFIFSGTIMDNIRYGRLDATDEEVIEAAKIVHAHEFIKDMEDGYYTQVRERGSRLSQGQKQLISFARALLADPRILILDEATSSVDTRTEMLIQEGLKELLKGRTSFVIAHRLSTIRNADRIMVIDHGRIIECGNHEELLKKRGVYYNLYKAQYKFLQAM
ncbi:ATP-binding cassette subfamily B protein [Caldicoprobacter guelmensis]|uniref:ABC transporter ATP-binding protein n=1 Tax=Caldicoprobacter guelmensis TaxID=1170224 RepID=UPI001959FA11|nr:ABC transporter ATP-binding protein [Caldicoprobacter guelmensis]MBM7582260.1 ATP-binding cassette subfamily B protein [Caldicoprobacter guelmensis]